MANSSEATFSLRGPLAGFFSWVLPGLGHLFIGERARGIVLLVTIVGTFWSGVAIGGVRNTVDPKERKLWFMAQMCAGSNAIGAVMLNQRLEKSSTPRGPYLSSEIAVHFTGVAGLLNILVILDAIGRAEPVTAAPRSRQRSTTNGP